MKAHPLVSKIKSRIREQKAWSTFALFPNRKRRAPKRVHIVTRGNRRFAVVAQNHETAERIIGEVEQ